MAKKISLSKGQFAEVDDDDFVYLNQWNWFAARKSPNHTFHAVRRVTEYGKDITILMHREIMGADNGLLNGKKLDIHHIDGNGLKNRRNNLHFCTRSEHIKLHKNKCGKAVDKP